MAHRRCKRRGEAVLGAAKAACRRSRESGGRDQMLSVIASDNRFRVAQADATVS